MDKQHRLIKAALWATLFITGICPAIAADPNDPAEAPPAEKPGIEDSIFNSKPTFLVAAEVNHATREYAPRLNRLNDKPRS